MNDSIAQADTPVIHQTAAVPPHSHSRGQRWFNVLLMMASLLVAIIGAELMLLAFHPLIDPYWRVKVRPDAVDRYIPSQFRPNLKLALQTEDNLPGMARQLTFSVNNVGFRGDSLLMPKPADEFRIFVIGGSTTECLYLDDRVAFTRVLQDSLQALRPGQRIKVYGAGKSGDKTYDHLAMLGHRIAHLQPDLIIVFPGVNDLLAAINGRDYLFLSRSQGIEHDDWDVVNLIQFMATEFQVGRLLFEVLKPRVYKDAFEDIGMISNIKRAADTRRTLPPSDAPPTTNRTAYRENLASIVALARAHGASILFLTQATTWDSKIDPTAEAWHWMNIGPDRSFPEPAMHAAMESYNDQLRELGASAGAPVFDLAAKLPKSMAYFYDDVHFNVKGASFAGGLVARFLASANPVP